MKNFLRIAILALAGLASLTVRGAAESALVEAAYCHPRHYPCDRSAGDAFYAEGRATCRPGSSHDNCDDIEYHATADAFDDARTSCISRKVTNVSEIKFRTFSSPFAITATASAYFRCVHVE